MENIERISEDFYGKFQQTHVLLYVGQNASAKDLRESLSKERWSAIITTNRSLELSSYFAAESRTLIECTSRKMLSSTPLSREKVPFIQLLGTRDNDEGLFVAPSPFEDEDERLFDRAKDLLRALPSMLGFVNSLVITGIDSDDDIKLLRLLGQLLEEEMTPGSVSLWNMESAFSGREKYRDWLKAICKDKSFEFHDVSLTTIIDKRIDADARDDEVSGASFEDDVFFCGQKPFSISQDDLLRTRSVGTLLTEGTIYRIRPLGKAQHTLWFSNFLELSGVGEPQWYGYLSQSNFHVKRDYEDALTQLVRRALRGQGVTENDGSPSPIILSGDPGSSKSVTLGALAYRIYNEKLNPVLFISNGSFLGNSYGEEFRSLIDALETVQHASGSGACVLVIWDGSSYREIEKDACALLMNLRNRSRNVVLVCSSYSFEGGPGQQTDYFSFDDESETFSPCGRETADVARRSQCLFVKADRLMTDQESWSFWQKASNYSGVSQQQIAFLKKALSSEMTSDIFTHYYYLVTLLRKRLEDSLEEEQIKASKFIQAERPECFKKIEKKRAASIESNPMWQAMLKAGFTPNQLTGLSDDSSDRNDDWSKRLEHANTYIAFFSRYKLDIPYSLVYSLMTDRSGENPLSEEGRDLFNVLTENIPWLTCGENENEEYVFRFRNSLEAKIFLERHSVDGCKLVEMACEIIDIYGDSFQKNQYEDLRLASKIQSLIRLMGPNSRYYEEGSFEHRSILSNLNKTIEALDRLLSFYRIPDEDSSFSLLLITLTREFYGKNVWEDVHKRSDQELDYSADGFSADSYELRLKKLGSAARLALRNSERLEQVASLNKFDRRSDYLRKQANGLIVESAQCSLEISKLQPQYLSCCKFHETAPISECLEPAQPYRTQFRKLSDVVRSDPTNGYAYNAMFSLFEREYQSEDCPEELRVEYLTQVMTYVDECETLKGDISSRGQYRDELSEHLAAIKSFADGTPVSIAAIEEAQDSTDQANSAFLEIYNRFLEQGNPAAIIFVCQKEIKDIASSTEDLSMAAILRCRTVLEFMTEPARLKCISREPNALATLIRVAWMALNGKRLSLSKECQETRMSQEDWHKIYQYCDKYAKTTPRNGQQPLLILLYALSALQISERSSSGFEKAHTIIQQIKEEQFTGPYRTRTPFIVCDESGTPIRYTGTVKYTEDRKGFARVNGIPAFLGSREGVHFSLNNFGRNSRMPEVGEVLSDLEIGMNYMGFTLFKEQGREERRHF